jgi:uncharacterized membrane protein
MRHRMAAAVLALLGLLLSAYLLLHRLGLVGELACGSGPNSCERVQASRYSDFLGIPVAAHGVAGYGAILVVALVGLQPRWLERREPALALVVLSAIGVAFTAYLKYLEFFRIHAVCRWCVVSAVLIVLLLVVGISHLRQRQAFRVDG